MESHTTIMLDLEEVHGLSHANIDGTKHLDYNSIFDTKVMILFMRQSQLSFILSGFTKEKHHL